MRRAALILAGLAVLATAGVAQSDDALDLNTLAESIAEVRTAHNDQVELLDETIGVLNDTNAILDCFQMEPVRYRSVELADGSYARTLVPTKATYPADPGVHWTIHVKRNCKALES